MKNQHIPSSHDLPVDPDLALLESYLDGELSSAELQSLQQRLSGDAELTSALSRLSEDFTVRQAVWTSLEGTSDESSAISRQVVRSIRRAGFWERSRNYVRAGVAVAACLICFTAGWVGRGTAVAAAPPENPKPAHIADAATLEPLLFQVALTDEAGNIAAVQRFDNFEEAQAFAAEVSKWQAEEAQKQFAPAPNQSGL